MTATADEFERRGFSVLDHFLDEAETETLSNSVPSQLSAAEPQCERPNNTLAPLRWNDRSVQQVLRSPQRMARITHTTGGNDLRWISAYLSVKHPSSGPLWWHQDWWCWDHPISLKSEAAQVAVLCYLSDADEGNGCLRVLPGSHRHSTPLHAVAAREDESSFCDFPGQRTLRVQGGDAVVLDYRLLHGTHANSARIRRDCLLLSFTPSWSSLPVEIQGHLIRHPAQPRAGEAPPLWQETLLPSFRGTKRDLPVNRITPSTFSVAD